ncbi:hypothetical protein [Candidatus Tisiphia endosymbiont of Mystacides longicornis]|uniref:hypothetical protein n=1 Tax=Candidatus Tisiphia endosymbiont of Mystacides longicornis TaxID=3139330 RepID=UPI003CCB5222
MDVKTVLNEVIKEHCPFIHNNRLNTLLDVAEDLTVKDKKIYSYFTLGKFIIEFNYLHAIKPLVEPLASIIKTELCRA